MKVITTQSVTVYEVRGLEFRARPGLGIPEHRTKWRTLLEEPALIVGYPAFFRHAGGVTQTSRIESVEEASGVYPIGGES